MEELYGQFMRKLAESSQSGEFWWLLFGFGAQAAFATRFLVQWVASERRKKSVMPVAFWYISLAGGLSLFIYAVHIANPVFMVGQAGGVFIYARNLVLIRRHRRHAPPSERTPPTRT